MTKEAAAPPPTERQGNTEPSPGVPTPPGAAEPHYEGSTQWVDGKPIGLSYSQLSTYGQCPKKFELKYRDPDAKAKERGLGSGTAGSAVHDTLEVSEYAGWFTLEREDALDRLQAEFLRNFKTRLTKEMERVNGDESRIYWGGRKSREWPDGETADWWRVNQRVFFRRYLQIRERDVSEGVLLVRDEEGNLPWIERRVSTLLDVGGDEPILITGMVDVTMYTAATGEPILRDWKTGRSQPDPFQLAVYSWLMREVGAITASLGEMAWLRGASMETLLKQHELDATVALIPDAFRNLYHGIASGFFPWIHNDMCPWCTVRDGCPYGATLPG